VYRFYRRASACGCSRDSRSPANASRLGRGRTGGKSIGTGYAARRLGSCGTNSWLGVPSAGEGGVQFSFIERPRSGGLGFSAVFRSASARAENEKPLRLPLASYRYTLLYLSSAPDPSFYVFALSSFEQTARHHRCLPAITRTRMITYKWGGGIGRGPTPPANPDLSTFSTYLLTGSNSIYLFFL